MQVYFMACGCIRELDTFPKDLRGLKQMSASKEKKTQEGMASSSRSDPRTAREAQKLKEIRRSNILYGTIAVIFVLVAIVTFVWKSNIVQKSAAAVTINGEKYTAAEVNYFYKNVYQNFLSSYSSYISMFGLDTSKSLKDQTCSMTDGGTWYDYFLKQGLEQMCAVHALVDSAKKEGYTYPDSIQTDVESSMKTLDSTASSYGYSTAQYLSALYGSTMTRKVYQEQLLLSMEAQSYSKNYENSLTYTTDQLTAAYQADTNTYDMVDCKYVKVDGTAATTTDADGKTVEATDAEKTAALETAKKLADSIYADYQAGGDLSKLAESNKDTATYTANDSTTYSDATLQKWLFDSSRKPGDSAVLDDSSSNSAYYVVVFNSRYRPEYDTVNVRHILIQPATGEKKEGEDGYEAEQTQLTADAKQKAEDLLAKWKAGEATEDSFAALAKENSSDTGSASDGGLISQVSKSSNLVDAFKSWCLEKHNPGDTGIVESSYGYHIMYFVGTDLPYWQAQVTSSLKSEDFNTWYEGLTKDYTATQHDFGMRFVG